MTLGDFVDARRFINAHQSVNSNAFKVVNLGRLQAYSNRAGRRLVKHEPDQTNTAESGDGIQIRARLWLMGKIFAGVDGCEPFPVIINPASGKRPIRGP